jgi:hypothetical protein
MTAWKIQRMRARHPSERLLQWGHTVINVEASLFEYILSCKNCFDLSTNDATSQPQPRRDSIMPAYNIVLRGGVYFEDGSGACGEMISPLL